MPDGNINIGGMGFNSQNTSNNNENRSCNCGISSNAGGILSNLCCGCDTEILFFIIIFLLLFTNFGCCK